MARDERAEPIEIGLGHEMVEDVDHHLLTVLHPCMVSPPETLIVWPVI